MATDCTDYDFSRIEPHWQSFWQENRTLAAEAESDKPTYYTLGMFAYPSGAGLHIGHPANYVPVDAVARFKRAQGYNVLNPTGWDAFGLPTEQYAVKNNVHPRQATEKNVARFTQQLRWLGLVFDWDREVNTTDPKYFRWTQWIFLQLFKQGLAFVDERPVWYCPALGTVLANEEVVDGVSEVGKHPVERRALRQWVLRITAYAEKLLHGLDDLNWPESTKTLQRNWIGRSEGAEVVFAIDGHPENLTVFTTRPDTLFGATYMVLAPEHPLVAKLTTQEHHEAVQTYIKASASKSDLDRTDLAKEKSGVPTGAFAINPVNGAKIPIWVADYVLMSYGTGAIMAVPAHDDRDYEFAQTFSLPIVQVIQRSDHPDTPLPFSDTGTMVNSGVYDGLPSTEAKQQITEKLAQSGQGQATVNYKLRDWLFSRQRYWGEPFPVVWVDEAAFTQLKSLPDSPLQALLPPEPVVFVDDGSPRYALPMPPEQLPLTLPELETYEPIGTGESPLARAEDWLNIHFDLATGRSLPATETPPQDGHWVRAKRETNTMPQWAGSCWYYLRYMDPHNDQAFCGSQAEKHWKGGPDIYIGGAEHAVLHLLYARFWHQVLYDGGHVSQPEPFKRLHHQGIILAEDGEKMSKSLGNVVNPETVSAQHGTDALRLYLMFLGPLEAMKPWSTKGIEGVSRFLRRVWRQFIGEDGQPNPKISDGAHEPEELLRALNQTIQKVTDDYENLRFNTVVSQLMTLSNTFAKADGYTPATGRMLLQLLAPLAPHITEELWQRTGNQSSIVDAPWPVADETLLIEATVKLIFQINGKTRGHAEVPAEADQAAALAAAQGDPKIAAHLDGKQIIKVIFVPGRILNLVVK
ncbi:MAG: leucine--tRNA ligase [Opitutales bacterium]